MGNGIFKISFTPILVIPGDDPILLYIIISVLNYGDLGYNLDLAVGPDAVGKDSDNRFLQIQESFFFHFQKFSPSISLNTLNQDLE